MIPLIDNRWKGLGLSMKGGDYMNTSQAYHAGFFDAMLGVDDLEGFQSKYSGCLAGWYYKGMCDYKEGKCR